MTSKFLRFTVEKNKITAHAGKSGRIVGTITRGCKYVKAEIAYLPAITAFLASQNGKVKMEAA